MKKIIGLMVVAGIVLGMMPVATMAKTLIVDEEEAVWKKAGAMQECYNKSLNTDAGLSGKEKIRNIARYRLWKDGLPTEDAASKNYVNLRGVWGLSGDNESDGYFGGKIARRGIFAVFKGLYNKTDNESFGKFFLIMKRGYFNGRVINPEGKSCKITGLYKIDKDEHTIKMRWMTRHCTGWAVGKVTIKEE